jgi:hypothetical protein
MFKADATYAEVTALDLWCDCGHYAKPEFRREGPDSLPEPTKFFKVSTEKHGVLGTYCEPCLIVANYAAKHKRKIQKEMEGEE